MRIIYYDEKGKSVILKANDKLPESALQDGYVINHTAWIYLITERLNKLINLRLLS
jgi:protein SCO1/2